MERKKPRLLQLTLSILLFGTVLLLGGRHSRAQTAPHLGYGFNVAQWDVALVEDLGFNWIKVFDPPAERLPLNVLLRLEANAAHLNDLAAFGDQVQQLATARGSYLEAYEIGNEVNLDAGYGWGAPPEAGEYARLLCEAYRRIKKADPASVVVSAGLAPTGRVSGSWNGHPGHNGSYQDEREYLREFIAAGGAACADAIGYHPYGFSAGYDAAPDVASADPAENCANGFCFRGAEKIREVLVGAGAGDKPLWATEFGWIVRPPDDCLDHPTFAGREWQLVSAEAQASNLAGAFNYAHEHWPWMGAMFVFNLNFNTSGWYETCHQIRYYGVQDRPAEEALRTLSKETVPGILSVGDTSLVYLAEVDDQPYTATQQVRLANDGWEAFTYQATDVQGDPIIASIQGAPGMLRPLQETILRIEVSSDGRPSGVYESRFNIQAGGDTANSPVTVDATLILVDRLRHRYLPLAVRP